MLDLLRRNRDLRLLFLAEVVSYLGDWFADVALLGLVLELTHSDLAASGVMVASFLPMFLVTPLAGAAADRLDRRWLVVVVSLLQCLAALALLGAGPGRVWVAFAARALIAGLGAFVAPALQAALPNVVDPHDLATANALLGSVWGAMLAAGAALGGAFTVAFGRSASFVADAATFVVAAALIGAITRPLSAATAAGAARAPMRPIRDTREAMAYARHRRDVLLLLCSKTGLGLAGGVVPLLAVYATRVFHGGDGSIGLLLAARGLGALAGPAVGRRFGASTVDRILLACGLAGLAYGAGYLLVAASPVIGLAMAGVFVAHLGGGGQWMLSNYGLQLVSPDELRGRMFATDSAVVTLTMSLSFLVAGWAATRFGPRPVTVALALVAAAWGVLYLSLTRSVRADGAGGRPASVEVDEG